MFQSLFSKSTTEDLLKLLKKEPFDESKANAILESVDINSLDNDGKSFLHHLCIENISEPIQWLVKNGINKELEDYYDDSALTLAMKYNSTKAFIKLLELGYDVDKQNRRGRTLLQDALFYENLEYFNQIKNYSKNINNIDQDGKNILFDAVSSGKNSLIQKVLLEDIDKTLIDNKGKPALLYDCVINNFETLKLLVHSDMDISLKDKNGNNLLYHLLKSEVINVDIIDFALVNKIDINAVNNNGNSILVEIIYILNEENSEENPDIKKNEIILNIVEKLFEHDIDLDIQNNKGQSALMIAADTNNNVMAKQLLEVGANINLEDKNSDTVLSMCAIKGNQHNKIISLLISYKANIYIKDSNNQTIIDKLVDAVLHRENKKRLDTKLKIKIDEDCDYFQILKEILSKSKIDLYSLNANDEPCFFEPLVYRNLNLFKLFMQAGYHINQPDINGLNVIYKLIATNKDLSTEEEKKYHICLKTILDMRADVNALDSFGGTTLHKAILQNDAKTVIMLMNANANLNAKDKQGRNFLHNSVWKNRVQIMRLIHSHNPKLINMPDNYGVLPINYAAFLGYTDLVVELITLGSVINNPTPKKRYIIDFLKKFHKNIFPMFKNARNSSDERYLAKLVANMRKEFEF